MDMDMDMDMDMSMTASASASTAPTMSMSMATSTSMAMSMATSTTMSMSMSSTFTTAFPTTPLLFPHLTPTTPAALFGIWLLIFATAILYRGLSFLKRHLEATSWAARKPSHGYAQPFSITRDCGRGVLELVVAMVGYSLMLVVMSFVVVYFFAVVIGLAVGEMVFRRLEVGLDVGGGKVEREHH